MSPNHTRRLSPEEIQASLPKILAPHQRRVEAIAQKKAVEAHQKAAAEVKIGASIGDSLRRAYSKGARFRGPKGRFLSLSKV